MPTNVLRQRRRVPLANASASPSKPAAHGPRRVVLSAGQVAVRAELLDTLTAERIWRALPLVSTAERWGKAVLVEVPVHSGRERSARINASIGDFCFWIEDQRVIVVFGETPISGAGQCRLPRPCNLWAKAIDDSTLLNSVRPGEKVSLTAVPEPTAL